MGLNSANQSSVEDCFVREARLDEVPAMVQMHMRLQAHLEERNPFVWRMGDEKVKGLPDSYRKAIEDEDALALVAETAGTGRVVGMGIGRYCVDEQHRPDRYGHIDEIWVDEAHRRKGLCKRIASELVAFLQHKGAEELVLRYIHGNTEAEAVWGRLGFRPVVVTATAPVSAVRERVRADIAEPSPRD
jgi:ribosomal protein S18 acetylase RimI-like enzyme